MEKKKRKINSSTPGKEEYWYAVIVNWNLQKDHKLYRVEDVTGNSLSIATCLQDIKNESYEEQLMYSDKTITKHRRVKAPIIVETIDNNYVRDIITGNIYIDATDYEGNMASEDIMIKRTSRINESNLAKYLRTFTTLDIHKYQKAIGEIEENLRVGLIIYREKVSKKTAQEIEDREYIKRFKRTYHKGDENEE